MALETPYPELDEFRSAIGAAGYGRAKLPRVKGAAGNISICIGWPIEVRRRFPLSEPIELPLRHRLWQARTSSSAVRSGCLRDIHLDPAANLGVIAIGADGRTGQLYTSPRRLFARVTSEFS